MKISIKPLLPWGFNKSCGEWIVSIITALTGEDSMAATPLFTRAILIYFDAHILSFAR